MFGCSRLFIPSIKGFAVPRKTFPEAFNGRLLFLLYLLRPVEPVTQRVYVVVYDPLLDNGQLLSDYLGWAEHGDMTQETVGLFRQASHGKLNYKVVETTVVTDGWPVKTDGFRYTEKEYLSVYSGQSPAHSPDSVDYNKIVNDQNDEGYWTGNIGPIYVTACNLIMLQLDKAYLPIYQR